MVAAGVETGPHVGRGWTYNIWGFACVKLKLGRKIIRVGTDDTDRLAKVIRCWRTSVKSC